VTRRCVDCLKEVRTEHDLCATCRRDPIDRALPPGSWVRRRHVWVFVPVAPPPGRPCIPTVFEWTDEELCRAHRQRGAGMTDDWTREGERVYQRNAKRRKRAQQAKQERTAA
jgi:hypothetical protein